MKINLKRKKGFTLLEMIVVVAIIAVIGAIVILPNINAINTVRKSVDKENTKVLESAFEQYYMDYSEFPSNVATGVVDLSKTSNPLKTLVDSNYLKTIPEIQSKKSNGPYKWYIKYVKPDTGDIGLEYK
jgi:prepilin-type N-terminal cleavage/methylation domain-containing protein